MPKIIKFHSVNISDDAHRIDVPDKASFKSAFPEGGEDETEAEISPEEILRHAEARAESITADANKRAEKIISDAKEQALLKKKAVFEEARHSGYDEGYAEGKNEAQNLITEAEITLREAYEEKKRILQKVEPDAVSLVISIVEKLLGETVKLNPEVVLYVIRTGLEDAPAEAKELSVRVSAEDFETASEMKQDILAYVDSDTELSIVKDARLSLGQCVIDTPIGSVDSSIDTQWNSVKNDLIQMLKASE